MTLSQLELFAEDTVRENKVQQEKIAERDSHIMILNETCRDFEGQLAQFQDSQIEAEVYGDNIRELEVCPFLFSPFPQATG
jgi:hypothetical protein